MNDNPLVKSLKELCQFLDAAGLEYVLVGGLAVGIWGAPRATVDVDFLVSFAKTDFLLLAQQLRESNKFVFIHDQPMIFQKVSLLRATLKSNTDISIDFLFADDDFKKEALKRRIVVQIAGVPVNISTPEDLILLKQMSSRPQDLLDAQKILDSRGSELDMGYMRKWAEKLGIKR